MPPKPTNARLTHFLCIPLITSASRGQLQASLNTFRSDVTADITAENPRGIPEKAIRPLGTLHLTLGVMSLLTPESVESALAILRSIKITDFLPTASPKEVTSSSKTKETQTDGLRVTLRGLTSMHEAQKTSVLYAAPVDEDSQLQDFCLNLREAFKDVLVGDTSPLLLHATILNTIYVPGARGKGSGHGKSGRTKLTIDAREILERYQDFEWMANVRIEKVAICKMGAQKSEDGNEEYVVEGEIEIP